MRRLEFNFIKISCVTYRAHSTRGIRLKSCRPRSRQLFAQNPMELLVLRRRLRLAGHSGHTLGTADGFDKLTALQKQNPLSHLMLRQARVAGQSSRSAFSRPKLTSFAAGLEKGWNHTRQFSSRWHGRPPPPLDMDRLSTHALALAGVSEMPSEGLQGIAATQQRFPAAACEAFLESVD